MVSAHGMVGGLIALFVAACLCASVQAQESAFINILTNDPPSKASTTAKIRKEVLHSSPKLPC